MKITKMIHRKSFLKNKDLESKYKSEKLRLKSLTIKNTIKTQKSQKPLYCKICKKKHKKLIFCSFCGNFCCEICLAKKRKNPLFQKNKQKQNFSKIEKIPINNNFDKKKLFLFVCVICEEDFIKLTLFEEFEKKISDEKKEEILQMNFMVFEKFRDHLEEENCRILDLEKSYKNEIFEIDKKILENLNKEKNKNNYFCEKNKNLVCVKDEEILDLKKKIKKKSNILEKIKNDIVFLEKENKNFLNYEFEILKKIEKLRKTVAKKNNVKLHQNNIFEDLVKFETLNSRVNLKSCMKKNNKKAESCKCTIF